MTTVLGVLGALVVLFVAASVAVRDEPLLAEVPPDRRDLDLPDDRALRSEDLEQVRFGMALRGYRMAEVDAVLERLGAELLERDERLARTEDEVERLRGQVAGRQGTGVALPEAAHVPVDSRADQA